MIAREIRLTAVKKNDRKAFSLMAACWALHLTTIALILVAPAWLGLLAAMINGIAIAQLFVMGHDACHLAFFSTHRRNRVLGRLLFLPTMTPFSVWHLIHNVRHHLHSNVQYQDGVWEPLDPADYAALSGWRRLRYRFYRSHAGVFAYYFLDYWLRQFVWPRRKVLGEIKLSYVADIALCWAYGLCFYGGVLALAFMQGYSLWFTALAVIFIPHAVWCMMMSITIYLQHTHPTISWFQTLEQWREANGRLTTTAYVRIPRWMSIVSLEMMEHPAHHLMPGVPVYNLRALNQALPADSYPSWQFNWREFDEVVRQCKLYDFEAGRWVPFPLAKR